MLLDAAGTPLPIRFNTSEDLQVFEIDQEFFRGTYTGDPIFKERQKAEQGAFTARNEANRKEQAERKAQILSPPAMTTACILHPLRVAPALMTPATSAVSTFQVPLEGADPIASSSLVPSPQGHLMIHVASTTTATIALLTPQAAADDPLGTPSASFSSSQQTRRTEKMEFCRHISHTKTSTHKRNIYHTTTTKMHTAYTRLFIVSIDGEAGVSLPLLRGGSSQHVVDKRRPGIAILHSTERNERVVLFVDILENNMNDGRKSFVTRPMINGEQLGLSEQQFASGNTHALTASNVREIARSSILVGWIRYYLKNGIAPVSFFVDFFDNQYTHLEVLKFRKQDTGESVVSYFNEISVGYRDGVPIMTGRPFSISGLFSALPSPRIPASVASAFFTGERPTPIRKERNETSSGGTSEEARKSAKISAHRGPTASIVKGGQIGSFIKGTILRRPHSLVESCKALYGLSSAAIFAAIPVPVFAREGPLIIRMILINDTHPF